MELFSEELRQATKETVQLPWSGGKNGKYFRCHFCGYKFIEGDFFRAIYTNDMPNAGGNPLVCQKCNDSTDKLRKKWQEIKQEAKERFWWLRKP